MKMDIVVEKEQQKIDIEVEHQRVDHIENQKHMEQKTLVNEKNIPMLE